MSNIPKTILVISIIRYTNNDEIVDTFLEYFNEVPHIDITDYDSNRQTIHYVIPSDFLKRTLVHKFYCIEAKDIYLDYSYYVLNYTSTTYHRGYSYDAYSMPDKIAVDSIITELQLWNTE